MPTALILMWVASSGTGALNVGLFLDKDSCLKEARSTETVNPTGKAAPDFSFVCVPAR